MKERLSLREIEFTLTSEKEEPMKNYKTLLKVLIKLIIHIKTLLYDYKGFYIEKISGQWIKPWDTLTKAI